MPRTWTKESRATFERERNRYLTEVDDPPSQPWDALSEDAKEAYLRTLPKKIVAEEFKRLTSMAWNISKRPLHRVYAPRGGTLALARGMNGKNGYDTARFRKGDDLNTIVYNHYDTRVDPTQYIGVNYVSNDGLLAKKREYLGPSPHVASYRFTADVCDIEFWEAYLEKAWLRETDWSVDVKAEYDEEVRWWFPADRSVYR